MKLGEAVFQEENETNYLNNALEFQVNDPVFIRHLDKTGIVVAVPQTIAADFDVKLDGSEEVVKVNWFNLFHATDKEKYSFKEEKKE